MKKCSVCGTKEIEQVREVVGTRPDNTKIYKKYEVQTEMDELTQDMSERFGFQEGTITTRITFCKKPNDFHCAFKAPTHNIFTQETVERLVVKREEARIGGAVRRVAV